MEKISKRFFGGRLVAVIGAVALLGACSEEVEEVAVQPPVQTLVVEAAAEVPFRRFPGTVAALQSTELSFDVAGRLVSRAATQGLVVKAGDVLAELDRTNFVTRFDAANSRFTNARDEMERHATLRQRGVISEREFQQFRTTFEVAETELRTAQRDLDDTVLRAPFDGRVARTLVNNLQNVQAKEPVLVFQNIASLEVDIQIPESDMSLAQRGVTATNARERLEALVEFGALPGRQFELSLKSFATEATPAARTFRVTFDLVPPEDANILPGMTSTVLMRVRPTAEVVAGEAGLYVLPAQAVATGEGSTWIWRLDGATSQVNRLPAEVVEMAGESMTVRAADLQAGDEVVVSGVRFLSEGMTVRRMDQNR